MGIFRLTVGDIASAEKCFKDLPENIMGIVECIEPVAAANVENRKNAHLGGRPVNYEKNVKEYVRKILNKSYHKQDFYDVLVAWFTYLSEAKKKTSLDVMKDHLTEIARVSNSPTHAKRVIAMSMKQKVYTIEHSLFRAYAEEPDVPVRREATLDDEELTLDEEE